MKNKPWAFCVALMTALVLLGCQNPPATGGAFLSDYGRLKPSSVAPGALVYRSPSAGTRSFGGFYVEPVVVAYASDAQRQMADAQRESEVKQYLSAKLSEALRTRVSPTAGAPSLRVRAAITDVDPARTSGTFQATVGPAGTATGHGTLEVEMLDAQTGDVVLAFIDRRDHVRPSGPQQVVEAKRQVDEAVARLLAELDAARTPR